MLGPVKSQMFSEFYLIKISSYFGIGKTFLIIDYFSHVKLALFNHSSFKDLIMEFAVFYNELPKASRLLLIDLNQIK